MTTTPIQIVYGRHTRHICRHVFQWIGWVSAYGITVVTHLFSVVSAWDMDVCEARADVLSCLLVCVSAPPHLFGNRMRDWNVNWICDGSGLATHGILSSSTSCCEFGNCILIISIKYKLRRLYVHI